jgi:hypothetical protein
MTDVHTEAERAHIITVIESRKLPLRVTVKRWQKERTEPQNNYLFGVCYPVIGQAMGYAKADLHEWVCGTFFGWTERKVPKTPHNPSGWESVPSRTTTTDENGNRDVIDPETFGRLLETVVFPAAARIDVVIPEPYKP